jgi:hypothetical protein
MNISKLLRVMISRKDVHKHKLDAEISHLMLPRSSRVAVFFVLRRFRNKGKRGPGRGGNFNKLRFAR